MSLTKLLSIQDASKKIEFVPWTLIFTSSHLCLVRTPTQNMPQDFSRKLATGEFCRCWFSISSTRPLPVAGTSWERTAVLGAARSDCGVAGATMSQCIHSLRQGMKGLYCTCSTILVKSKHPFKRIMNKRTCASQRATRANRVGERRRQVRVSSIATIGS